MENDTMMLLGTGGLERSNWIFLYDEPVDGLPGASLAPLAGDPPTDWPTAYLYEIDRADWRYVLRFKTWWWRLFKDPVRVCGNIGEFLTPLGPAAEWGSVKQNVDN